MDYACMINDIYSYQKEVQFEGEIHNLVLVVRNFFDTDSDTAMRIVGDLMDSRMREFEHVTATGLPALFADFDLGEDAKNTLLGYAEELRNWLSGILEWHEGCRRYAESDLLRHFPESPGAPSFSRPSGLGTAAFTIIAPPTSPQPASALALAAQRAGVDGAAQPPGPGLAETRVALPTPTNHVEVPSPASLPRHPVGLRTEARIPYSTQDTPKPARPLPGGPEFQRRPSGLGTAAARITPPTRQGSKVADN